MAAASRPLPHTLPPLSFFRCRWAGGGVAVGLRRAGRSGVEDDGVVERRQGAPLGRVCCCLPHFAHQLSWLCPLVGGGEDKGDQGSSPGARRALSSAGAAPRKGRPLGRSSRLPQPARLYTAERGIAVFFNSSCLLCPVERIFFSRSICTRILRPELLYLRAMPLAHLSKFTNVLF